MPIIGHMVQRVSASRSARVLTSSVRRSIKASAMYSLEAKTTAVKIAGRMSTRRSARGGGGLLNGSTHTSGEAADFDCFRTSDFPFPFVYALDRIVCTFLKSENLELIQS